MKSKRPLILVTPSLEEKGTEFADISLSLSNRYPAAIEQAGGLPWVMPCITDPGFVAECVARADGVLLTGGDDIEPSLYCPKVAPEILKTVTVADPKRDLLELLVIGEVLKQRKPLLAICRGHQLMNVAFGGNLIVDIPLQFPTRLKHARLDKKDRRVHDIRSAEGSLFRKLMGRPVVGVNSTHHQAVLQAAAPMVATAWSSDGLVEVMEMDPGQGPILPFFLSVQFHPERLVDRFPVFRGLFRAFTRACQPTKKS